ncbi:hypothetical protein [Actinophytocola algeriensis]|jgi:hypothetical protein|uniref:Flavin-binding protein dodecin n=1 Tax=Actinophytocola algeriensis TaxID=1768010 RepID=A0A7W7VCX8_9PSEU|nr:hypothetical protein [Actinophytocola algeriensis]MBB4905504.1 flavin-binding protein dodecin [Actinophytocola algeriensis]MBE1472811.1 flavin-binding protein dodecin [Actinophytocola algeriensis]
MGLFDAVREKAAELLSGATDKVSELTGTDIADAQQNATDAASESAQNLGDTAQGYADTASGAGQDLAGTAADSVQNVTDTAADTAYGTVADTPVGDYIDPRGQQ